MLILPILQFLGIIFFSVILIKGTDIIVVHVKSIARKTNLGGYYLTAIIIGMATSLPELFVGITSSLDNQPILSLGNVIGSNIADISLVVGLAAVIGGSLKVKNHDIEAKDLLHAFIAGIIPFLLLLDKTLSRVDGLILISMYGFYNYLILNRRRKYFENEDGIIVGLLRRIHHNHVAKDFMYTFLGISAILFSSDMIVKLGGSFAKGMGIPIILVGLFIVAVGTSLPELAFEIEAIKKKETEMFLGNLLGSLVANGTFIIGITALINPITVQAISEYYIAIFTFIVTFVMFFIFIHSKKSLERWKGILLIAAYLMFLTIEFF